MARMGRALAVLLVACCLTGPALGDAFANSLGNAFSLGGNAIANSKANALNFGFGNAAANSQANAASLGGNAIANSQANAASQFGNAAANSAANAFSAGGNAVANSEANAVSGRRLLDAFANDAANAFSLGGNAIANSEANALNFGFGNAAANSQANAASLGGNAIANSQANAASQFGNAAANSNANAFSAGGNAVANSEANAVSGRRLLDAFANDAANAFSLGGNAIANSEANALNFGFGNAAANSQANAASFGGNAIANSQANAASQFGNAAANSDANAFSVGGNAVANSEANAVSGRRLLDAFANDAANAFSLGGNALANSKANALNFGFGNAAANSQANAASLGGNAIANSQANAASQFGNAAANSNANAFSAGGNAVANSEANAVSGRRLLDAFANDAANAFSLGFSAAQMGKDDGSQGGLGRNETTQPDSNPLAAVSHHELSLLKRLKAMKQEYPEAYYQLQRYLGTNNALHSWLGGAGLRCSREVIIAGTGLTSYTSDTLGIPGLLHILVDIIVQLPNDADWQSGLDLQAKQPLDDTDTIQTYMSRMGLLFPQAVGKLLQDVAAGNDLDPTDYQLDASVMLTAPGWAKALITPEIRHLACQELSIEAATALAATAASLCWDAGKDAGGDVTENFVSSMLLARFWLLGGGLHSPWSTRGGHETVFAQAFPGAVGSEAVLYNTLTVRPLLLARDTKEYSLFSKGTSKEGLRVNTWDPQQQPDSSRRIIHERLNLDIPEQLVQGWQDPNFLVLHNFHAGDNAPIADMRIWFPATDTSPRTVLLVRCNAEGGNQAQNLSSLKKDYKACRAAFERYNQDHPKDKIDFVYLWITTGAHSIGTKRVSG
ncbi:hypothetical protein WJX73_005994 [Symbiochloris irregularis]|uniref:Uncharacterized protein n=1 Tax=Symbiochloris irregularis TaxID=706552 RepID=A0AAW1P299_9CHLO